MLFPIGDDDRKLSKPALVTWALIAANVLLFAYQNANPSFTYGWSVVPAEITSGVDLVGSEYVNAGGQRIEIPQTPGPTPIYLTLISSMFMHGGLMHIAGNLLYLWIFGDNVEHRFGGSRFLLFYLVSGLAGTFAQIYLDPASVIPNLGASGAISGVLGAYLVLFPRNRVNVVFFIKVIALPAILVIGLWAVFQFINGYGAIAATEETAGGVAYGAHIGGFIAGVVMALAVRGSTKERESDILARTAQRDPRSRRLWR
ncbi:MAG: rhomboid family intramembrane serine protease [Bacteroidota bacterium]